MTLRLCWHVAVILFRMSEHGFYQRLRECAARRRRSIAIRANGFVFCGWADTSLSHGVADDEDDAQPFVSFLVAGSLAENRMASLAVWQAHES